MNEFGEPRSFASEGITGTVLNRVDDPLLDPAGAEAVRPQHEVALERADFIRFRRADIRFALREGLLSVEEVLGDEAAQTMLVIDLIRQGCRNKPGGKRREGPAYRTLDDSGITEFKTVRELSDRQREALSEELPKNGYLRFDVAEARPRSDKSQYLERFARALDLALEIRRGE
jgi:hypothetical protein